MSAPGSEVRVVEVQVAEVRVVEVGPRDGLQNESGVVPVATRIAFVEALLAAGLGTIEVGSFVSPRWVPQMQNTDAVLRAFAGRPQGNFPVLVPNEIGLEAALAAGAREVAIFGAASEAFSRKNVNCSIAESIDRFRPVAARALAAGARVRGYLSCVLGCPYQGHVPAADVVRVADALMQLGCYEISLGDTIGVGTPRRARDLVRAVADVTPMSRIAVHFHDTYGQALANVYACLEEGVHVVDAAAGGLGGCPYAKGASGNLATEDLVYMLDGMGVSTGVALPRLLEASRIIEEALGRRAPSKVALARRLPAN